jgi:hypothetical protein
VQERCEGCGFDGRALSCADVAGALGQLPERVRGIAVATPDDVLRRRPPTGGWAAIEYLGHLRDLLAFHRWVIERALTEQEPDVGGGDPDAAVEAARYIDAEAEDLLAQLERRAGRLRELLGTIDDLQARRRVTVEAAQGPVAVVFVARSVLHEGVHHTLDLAHLCS